jgi:hypothetical protein
LSNLFSLPKQTPVTASGGIYSGSKAYFYRTGTSTPKDTYSDAALSVPNSNPVVADSGGLFGPIFLDTSDFEYRLTLKTSADVLIYTQDNVGGKLTQAEFNALIVSGGAATLGAVLYPRTSAEIAAGVTPSNYVIPSHDSDGAIYPERYSSNDDTALTNAFAVATQLGGGWVRLRARTYTITISIALPLRIKLSGAGPRATIFQINNAIVGLTRTASSHGLDGVIEIEGIGFKGTSSAVGAISMTKTDFVTIHDCRFYDFTASSAYGISLTEVFRWWIYGCNFDNIERRGVLMAASSFGCNAGTFGPRNEVIGNNQANFRGVEVVGQNIEIFGNDFEGSTNGLVGIYCNGVDGAHIHDNYIELWTAQAIKLDAVAANTRILIEQNVLNCAAAEVINCDSAGTSNVRVRQNRFPDMAGGTFCVRVGAGVDIVEWDNDPGTSLMTDTYAVSKLSVPQQTSTFTLTLTGCTTSPTGTARVVVIGRMILIYIPEISATSNTTACTATGIPAVYRPARNQVVGANYRDNGNYANGLAQVDTSGVITLFNSARSSTFFTASGTKGVALQTLIYSTE